MCFLDVTSLFTNVPLDETTQICLDRLYSLPEPSQLPRSVLRDLLKLASKKSHFIFDGQYYDQTDGVSFLFFCIFFICFLLQYSTRTYRSTRISTLQNLQQ